MPKPIAVGDTVKIKPTQRTVRARIANMQAEVVARLGAAITIEVGDIDSPVYGHYQAEESDLERVGEAGQD